MSVFIIKFEQILNVALLHPLLTLSNAGNICKYDKIFPEKWYSCKNSLKKDLNILTDYSLLTLPISLRWIPIHKKKIKMTRKFFCQWEYCEISVKYLKIMLATKVLVMSKYVTFLKPTSCFWRTYQRKTGIPFPTNLSRIIVRFERKIILRKTIYGKTSSFYDCRKTSRQCSTFPALSYGL